MTTPMATGVTTVRDVPERNRFEIYVDGGSLASLNTGE